MSGGHKGAGQLVLVVVGAAAVRACSMFALLVVSITVHVLLFTYGYMFN